MKIRIDNDSEIHAAAELTDKIFKAIADTNISYNTAINMCAMIMIVLLQQAKINKVEERESFIEKVSETAMDNIGTNIWAEDTE